MKLGEALAKKQVSGVCWDWGGLCMVFFFISFISFLLWFSCRACAQLCGVVMGLFLWFTLYCSFHMC